MREEVNWGHEQQLIHFEENEEEWVGEDDYEIEGEQSDGFVCELEISANTLKTAIKEFWDYTGIMPHDGLIEFEDGWSWPSPGDPDWVLLNEMRFSEWLAEQGKYMCKEEELLNYVIDMKNPLPVDFKKFKIKERIINIDEKLDALEKALEEHRRLVSKLFFEEIKKKDFKKKWEQFWKEHQEGTVRMRRLQAHYKQLKLGLEGQLAYAIGNIYHLQETGEVFASIQAGDGEGGVMEKVG
ncbi:MAG: hypothetical protein H8E27_08055 [Verrucomicrobia subdivision 3 bacterium]|nr:hypothetical protein [Limisphaerales bacterium]